MADEPASGGQGSPAPEVLKPQSDTAEPTAAATEAAATQGPRRFRRASYRPSHRATFIGLGVVVLILIINAAIVAVVLKSQSDKSSQSNQAAVSINQSDLNKLGVNQTAVGDQGIELTVNPNAKFNGTLQVGGDVSLGGQVKASKQISAPDANLTQLEAGNTSLSQVNVNGDGTISNLNLRKNLIVAGTSTVQGSSTFSGLVTANSGLNVGGNLSVSGTLAIGSFQTGNITIGGHFITSGSLPSISSGNVGSGGTVNMSGNDAAGTIQVDIGSGGGGNGTLANVSFKSRYTNTPHVIVTPVGSLPAGCSSYVNRSTASFSVGVNCALGQGGIYAFDYIVEQ